ncbi:MAG TPA: GTP cyclohydrolase MptA [Conexibacter sp.]
MELGLAHRPDDVQASQPAIRISLSRVGVAGVEKVIRIAPADGGAPKLFSARLDCFVDLGPAQRGAHMSRFEEVVNDAIGDVVLTQTAFRAEQLARRIAERVREGQEARRAEVTISAQYPEERSAPVSGIKTQEIFTLHGSASATAGGTRQITGVTAQGITACPRAQRLVADAAVERLHALGFSRQDIGRILDAVPVATHNQRGLGTLCIGACEGDDTEIDALTLVDIVEGSMSSAIYELMKRSDEAAVVERAHRRARSAEDCVREMLRGVVERFADLHGDHFVLARQENLETVHAHGVVAERCGLLSEIRAELSTGARVSRHTSREEWLDAGET